MPPPNAANGRKQSNPGRIVPAIPFALTKPKSASKQKPASEPEARVQPKEVRHDVVTNGSDDPKEQKVEQQAEQSAEQQALANGPAKARAAPEQQAMTSFKHQHEVEEAPSTQAADRAESVGSAPMSMSEATTPDIAPSHASVQTPAPIEATSPTTTISPGPSRKPTDRFDMRQIKTELPPEFVPSSGKYTPQSAASSGRDTASSSRPNVHVPRPSTNGIVFGGMEPSYNAAGPSSTHFNNNMNTSRGAQPPYFPPNHFHHSSEPPVSRPFFPQPINTTAPWDSRQPYPQQENGIQFQNPRFAHRAAPSIDAQPTQLNGFDPRSRSESQASSAVVHSNEDAYLSAGVEPTSATRQTFTERSAPNGPVGRYPSAVLPPQYVNPELSARVDNAEALRDYLVSFFADSSYSDCSVEISDELDSEKVRFNLHKIMLSRSQILRDLMSNGNGTHGQILSLTLHGKYTSVRGVAEALPYLYGAPLLQLDFARQTGLNGQSALPSNEERMQRALQYIAAGCWLKIHPIAVRGMDIAANILHWDTVSEALAFALDGGISRFWSGELGRDEAGNGAQAPTYEPYSTSFLQRIVHFIVHVFPHNFYLDATAPQLTASPRLPTLPTPNHASRPSRSDPRLSKIQFGEVRADEHQRPSYATTTISSVLLSLPFPVLKTVLEHYDLAMRLGPDTVGSVMRQVVAEREVRRGKILAAGGTDSSTSPDLIDNLHWEESVQPSQQHRAGFRLSRKRSG